MGDRHWLGVSLDERDDFEITGSEVVRHRDLDCGKRFGDKVYCVSRSFYSRRTLTSADGTPAVILNLLRKGDALSR